MRNDGVGPARVVSMGRNAAWIAFEDEDFLRPATLRKHIERLQIVAGDMVLAQALDEERAIINAREPRTFALERTTAGGRTKTMAANIDAIAIVAAFDRPALHRSMIDELLAFAEISALRAFLLLTKADLASPEQRATIAPLYRSLGYPTFELEPRTGAGVDEVRAHLAPHRALLIGQSGVGKSSLFGALGGSGTVGAVSKSGRGRQTTTCGRLQRFGAGFLIDSPGIGEFELRDLDWEDVLGGFVEMRALGAGCRFRDCTHRSEPTCAIRASVEEGLIAPSRYKSYLEIVGRPKTSNT